MKVKGKITTTLPLLLQIGVDLFKWNAADLNTHGDRETICSQDSQMATPEASGNSFKIYHSQKKGCEKPKIKWADW